jgi:hypothetical protein
MAGYTPCTGINMYFTLRRGIRERACIGHVNIDVTGKSGSYNYFVMPTTIE